MAGMSNNGGSGNSGNVRGGSVRQPNYRAAADVGSGSGVAHNCHDDCDHGLCKFKTLMLVIYFVNITTYSISFVEA